MKKKAKLSPKMAGAVTTNARDNIQVQFQSAQALQQQGALIQAEEVYRKILAQQPRHFDALHMLGIVCAQTNRLHEAAELIENAISHQRNNAASFNNLGNIYQYLKNYPKAIDNFKKAIALKPDYAFAFFNMGNSLVELGMLEDALESYENAIITAPNFVDAFVRRGNVLRELNQQDAAIQSYERAIVFRPNDASVLNGLGSLYLDFFQPEKSLEYFKKAVSIQSDFAEAYFNLGNAYEALRKFDLALENYNLVSKYRPDYDYLKGLILFLKLCTHDWTDFDDEVKKLETSISEGFRSSYPFSILAISNSLSIQKKVAEIYIKDQFQIESDYSNENDLSLSNKIRIGYYSSDFRNHPVSYLIAELFEIHDRDKFEIFGFSFGPDDADPFRTRIASAVDNFIDVSKITDAEVVALSRRLGIHVAIDLGGLTQSSRTAIFSMRAAPVQINYLGFPGTMGAEFMDYIVADKMVIPEEDKKYYIEKIIYLPDVFQVNDRRREISDDLIFRKDFNLPEESFVFCCFNNNYKITPSVFDLWMRILRQVPASVLWLKAEGAANAAKLRQEAVARGVTAERLVFAERVPQLSQHLARHRLADLFLDTLPYNAHTTASDALWAGLPVLTCPGETFASRVAASLLNAIHLPELVVSTLTEYEALAIELATNSIKLQKIRERLKNNRLSTPLFDTPLFAKNIEAAYIKTYINWKNNLPKTHVYIENQ